MMKITFLVLEVSGEKKMRGSHMEALSRSDSPVQDFSSLVKACGSWDLFWLNFLSHDIALSLATPTISSNDLQSLDFFLASVLSKPSPHQGVLTPNLSSEHAGVCLS